MTNLHLKEQKQDFPYSFSDKKLPPPDFIAKNNCDTSIIDPQDLENYETFSIAQEVLRQNDPIFDFNLFWQMLLKENSQYRKGFFPRIESKILGVIAFDTAKATDFLGKIIRSKESANVLVRIVKLSEIYELLKEIDEWFSKKDKRFKEFTELTEHADNFQELLGIAVQAQIGLPEEKQAQFEQSIQKLREFAEKRRSLEYDLISEVVDIHYNLIHFMLLDPDASAIYLYWIQQVNDCLQWTFSESMALTVAKYHPRIFKKGGKNNSDEYVEIAKLINNANTQEFDANKIVFPRDESLKQLVQILDRMRSESPQEGYPYETTLKMRLEFLRKKFKIQSFRNTLTSKARSIFGGLKTKFPSSSK